MHSSDQDRQYSDDTYRWTLANVQQLDGTFGWRRVWSALFITLNIAALIPGRICILSAASGIQLMCPLFAVVHLCGKQVLGQICEYQSRLSASENMLSVHQDISCMPPYRGAYMCIITMQPCKNSWIVSPWDTGMHFGDITVCCGTVALWNSGGMCAQPLTNVGHSDPAQLMHHSETSKCM